jgi:glycerol-3-phosphate acyltransferase PlsY
MIFQLLIALVLAYFTGSVPTGLWIGRGLRGIDIRNYGSGNLGATNAFRVLGKGLGSLVLLIDVLKGVIPVVLYPRLVGIESPTPGIEMLIGAGAIAGHVLSCFVHFKGGKGVATALGVFLAIAPPEMFIILAIGIIIIAVTGYVSLASITGATLLPIFLFASGRPTSVLFVAILISAIVLWRHRSNLVRLVQGRENRFYQTDTGPDREEQIRESVRDR